VATFEGARRRTWRAGVSVADVGGRTWRRSVAAVPRGARALGIVATLLGILAAWVTVPPITTRNEAVPIVMGAVAVILGLLTVRLGQVRQGWTAVAIGVLGAVLGAFATTRPVSSLEDVFVWGALVASMLRFATPLVFAALGGMFSERSGVVNIGLEGMMLSGCFWGILVADKASSWELGVLAALVGGGLLALIHGVVSIHLRADQIVSGTAVNFLALGMTGYLFIAIYGDEGTPTDIPAIPNVHLSFLDGVPFLGDAFGNLNLMIWLSFVALFVVYVVLFKTPFGLRLRSCGEHPRAADTVGLSVYGIRYTAVVISGMLAALGGAFLSIGFVHSFSENMTGGRGFIALAALIFGNWRPKGAFLAALLFGFASALAARLPSDDPTTILFQALPYVLTLIAVAGIVRRPTPPASIGIPYVKQ
jgi:general nucleoside transport system permease protein